MNKTLPVSHRLRRTLFSSLLPILVVITTLPARSASTEEQIRTLKTQRDDAIAQVQRIVNQPVHRLPRVPGMDVGFFSPGWFHAGATTPAFDTVDIRSTQSFAEYVGHAYVTSDLNPGDVFRGSEVEFNPMTKYFYLDRTTPKKKLTEAEMVQINDLYRIIGLCNRKLNALENRPPPWLMACQWCAANKPVVGGVAVALLVLLFVLRKRKTDTVEY